MEDWWLDVRIAAWRESHAMWCWIFHHQWKPYESPVGWRGVKQCQRCRRFNPMSEWQE